MNLLQRTIIYTLIYGLGLVAGYLTESLIEVLAGALYFGIFYLLLSFIVNRGVE